MNVTKRIKIMSIFGTRPEAIKMAPLIKLLDRNKYFESKICVTAQHREMLDQVLELFDIDTDYDLDIMKYKQNLTGVTNRVLVGLENIYKEYTPDMILVHGDTTTTFAAALSAFYKKIKVGHVEAGLRSFEKYSPYPEEMNRRLTGVIADLNFAPTEVNKRNLLTEGVKEENIFVTGNTVIDALKYTVKDKYKFENDILNDLDYENKKIIMVTAHRRENWGKGIENICKALRKIVENNNEVEIVFLVHLNPIVRNTVYKYLENIERVYLLPPINTREAHNLMNKCYMVMTDSGGLQEEAPYLSKPVLVFRDVTEREEAVEYGTVKLVGTAEDIIIKSASELLNNREVYNKMSTAVNPYGDGKASERIIDSILYYFNISDTRPNEF
ncbi:UDP-N-acetylglucosamine 2-epimerase [Clostridium tepidiprofundi DSM 19306]|uniref:UDP-N-acetylglucosamine 2-epimerase (non-hydrolyzing) n=1 Tax=Clostridium tepidiprofundi DSM 19306 TaxID=1121338 RepID=A0A151B6A1_9CLOT|nr:UDP-N-acetylglucosamine 2-epimerase (non-hydrolyzing) [Clostridium tepidiprofundi]KYH35436.1 UDP-N-acetylglucosamine 2-epimerase [Clostridium tepidiprofundi DSM 19306]